MEFIAALAAGYNSKLMVMATSGRCVAAAVALVCASWQTRGHVVCILRSKEELPASRKALGKYADSVEFAVGDAWKLLCGEYKSADFVLMDWELGGEREREIFPEANGRFLGARLLPIGKGLVVGRIPLGVENVNEKRGWVFEVDGLTGEQHFYKINSSYIR